MDQAIRNTSWRNGRYTIQRNDTRTLISSVGDISFECTYYKSKTEKNTFAHLLEDLIGLERNERFTEVATYVDNSVFCADKYHLMKYINAAAAQMPDEKDNVKTELWHLLYSKQKNARIKFDTYTAAMMNSAKKAEKIEDLRKYVLGNWSAVRRALHNKLVNGCSAESHVSHVLSDRLSSRPMGWSQTGADRMSKLRCYDRNNGRAAIIDLVKYSRERRYLKATGTDGIAPQDLQLRTILAGHYNQAASYIERMQAHIPYRTV